MLDNLGIEKADGFLLDLGVSSYQLDEADRGFSYMHDAPLDMRMNRENEYSAWNVVNEKSEKELNDIIFKYGEEKWAKRIAQFIVQERAIKPIETTYELVEVIKKAVPKGARRDGPHPAKRTFQAIRIEVIGQFVTPQKTAAIPQAAQREGESPISCPAMHPKVAPTQKDGTISPPRNQPS